MDERLENKRWVAYCPVTDRLVNLELSSIKKKERKTSSPVVQALKIFVILAL